MAKRKVFHLAQTTIGFDAYLSLKEYFDVVGVVLDECDENNSFEQLLKQDRVPFWYLTETKELVSKIKELNPDVLVSASFRRVLPKECLDLVKGINVHFAPLPRYRGRANVNWALINGEKELFLTIHEIHLELDGGDILFQRPIPISQETNIKQAYELLRGSMKEHLGKVASDFIEGKCKGKPQLGESTFCCARIPEDGLIDFNWSSKKICNFVRALGDPFPPAVTFIDGVKIFVDQCREVSPSRKWEGRIPGRVVAIDKEGGSVRVLAGEGEVDILLVHAEGDGPVAATQFVKSFAQTFGKK